MLFRVSFLFLLSVSAVVMYGKCDYWYTRSCHKINHVTQIAPNVVDITSSSLKPVL